MATRSWSDAYSVPRKTGAQDGSDACRIRIYLSKYSSHWFSTWGNVHLSWVMYPPSYTNGWSEHWVIIPSGLLSYLGSDLHNIVLTAEQSQFYVDYVELSKACDSPVLIENHGFYANMNELPYKSSGTLKAGYDVGSSFGNGNVIINNSATQIFKSQNNIFLEPGFEAVQGSNFQTFIESCDNRSANRIMQDSIPDIIVNEDRIQILNCGEDSLSISGLDGDTSNYTFSWNFGNGVNSTDKVAKIYYSVPGTYLVTMILTDSNNITDTLTKTYIVPDCTRKNNLHMKESKIIIYPNPSDGNFTVDIGSIEVGVEKLEIYSMLGNVIYATSKITENKLLQFSLKENKRGLYIIKFMTNDGTVISKLIELNN